jgi:hypothetical protein
MLERHENAAPYYRWQADLDVPYIRHEPNLCGRLLVMGAWHAERARSMRKSPAADFGAEEISDS